MINNLEKLAIQEAINQLDYINFNAIAAKVEHRLKEDLKNKILPSVGDDQIKHIRDIVLEITQADQIGRQNAREWLSSVIQNK